MGLCNEWRSRLRSLVFAFKGREYLLPVVFARGTVEGGEYEHKNFRSHTYRQQGVASCEVEYFEQCSKNHHGGTDGVCKIEEPLAVFAGYERAESSTVCMYLSHFLLVLFVRFLAFCKADLCAHTPESYI